MAQHSFLHRGHILLRSFQQVKQRFRISVGGWQLRLWFQCLRLCRQRCRIIILILCSFSLGYMVVSGSLCCTSGWLSPRGKPTNKSLKKYDCLKFIIWLSRLLGGRERSPALVRVLNGIVSFLLTIISIFYRRFARHVIRDLTCVLHLSWKCSPCLSIQYDLTDTICYRLKWTITIEKLSFE